MQDRFKFRAVLHQNKYEEYRLEKFSHQRVFDVMSINLGIEYSTIEIIAEYPNGDLAVREIDDEDIDLIQCTGLKDKNSKMIYEGDILLDIARHDKPLYVVKWNKSQAQFYIKMINPKKYELYAEWNLGRHDLDYEVIGNIYENPELLEVEND